MMPVITPTLELERSMFESGTVAIVGCDEVGRGALAGPVAVGMTLLSATAGPAPEGLRDSKLVSEPKRELLAPRCMEWVELHSVGLASAQEIDELGIIRALGIAGRRALSSLIDQGAELGGAIVLLDGQHDYLSPELALAVTTGGLRVTTRVKADRDCASVAAASVIAKVHRDRIMIGHSSRYDGYGWARNKGYGSPEHLEAIARLGATDLHRRSWLTRIAEGAMRVGPDGSDQPA